MPDTLPMELTRAVQFGWSWVVFCLFFPTDILHVVSSRAVQIGGSFAGCSSSGSDSGSANRREFCTIRYPWFSLGQCCSEGVWIVYESFALVVQSGVWVHIGNCWKLLVVLSSTLCSASVRSEDAAQV